MNKKIGIRLEDKYVMERRVPITPDHVKTLIQNEGLEIYVQPSAKRIFKDEEFKNAGAVLTENLNEAPGNCIICPC